MKDDRLDSQTPAGRRDPSTAPATASASTQGGAGPERSRSQCPHCEAELSSEARFCHLCGVSLRGPDPEAVAAEADELLTAAHHSSPKIIVEDQRRSNGKNGSSGSSGSSGSNVRNGKLARRADGTIAPKNLSGKDLLTTTPYRGLDVQCEDEAVFFTEELEQDKPDDFSDLVGRRPTAKRTGLRTTLLAGGLALAALGLAVWIIERDPAPPKTSAASVNEPSAKASPPRNRAHLEPRSRPAPTARLAPAMKAPTPAAVAEAPVTPPAVTPAAPVQDPAAMTTPTAMTATTAAAVVAAAATPAPRRAAPVAAAVAVPRATPAVARAATGEASVADQLAARASALLTRNQAQAQKLAQAALAQNPSHPIARRVMARIHEARAKRLLYSGANAAAAGAARTALKYDSTRANALFYLGVALHEQRRRGAAARTLSRYLKRCPRCGYNSLYARQLVTMNRKITAAKPRPATNTPPAPRAQ